MNAMVDGRALVRRMRRLSPAGRARVLEAAGAEAARRFLSHWPAWARDGQLPPHDDWRVWVMLAGRGFGKTRAGAEWVSGFARSHPEARIALVAATAAEARRVAIEGTSGLLALARAADEPCCGSRAWGGCASPAGPRRRSSREATRRRCAAPSTISPGATSWPNGRRRRRPGTTSGSGSGSGKGRARW